ncbi:hypothetical protein ACFYXF_00090 [Streptomyces sp. NPDC002680]|uniref:hypothetical protein n=1 Tax=Streptomyces sp. NPDC002680 TaxID=3364659 RepID=UPI00367A1342
MEPMTAYDVARRITEERGWTWTHQFFDGQVRQTAPVVGTSAQSSDLDALLRELENLWQRLSGDDAKHL